MAILSDIRILLKKYLKNPLIIGGLAYIIYKLISGKSKKESFGKNIKVVYKDKDYKIIFDTVENLYSIIYGFNVISAKDLNDAKNKIKKIKKEGYEVNNKMNTTERLNRLYENVVLKEATSKDDIDVEKKKMAKLFKMLERNDLFMKVNNVKTKKDLLKFIMPLRTAIDEHKKMSKQDKKKMQSVVTSLAVNLKLGRD